MATDDCFKIFVDQLREGKTASIDEQFDSSFLLESDEEALAFRGPIEAKGEAYLAGDELILHLALRVSSIVPCIICCAPVEIELSAPNVYYSIPLREVPHAIFDMRELVREEILLAVHPFAECSGGHCPQRQEAELYLKKRQESRSPFDGLTGDSPVAEPSTPST